MEMLKMSEGLSNNNNFPPWLSESANRIIDHMNLDHADPLAASLISLYEVKDKNAKMVKLETDGYHIYSNDEYFFIPFSRKCNSVEEYKAELIKQFRIYRSFGL